VAVHAAALIAVAAGSDATPAVVGPSGGFVGPTGGIKEWGRNIGQVGHIPPIRLDFVAGYWVFAERKAVEQVGGFDPGFYLYWEDVDLSCRLAIAGAPVVAYPGLPVDHNRGATIRGRLLPVGVYEEARAMSAKRFSARWL
jgi:GT2 family glycosyltransferase